MAFCSSCGAELPEGATVCASCGASTTAGSAAAPIVNEYDHTADFTPEDIQGNKIYALCGYLFSVLGLAIIYLGAKESPFAMFHAKQALKLLVTETIVSILTVALCWTCIVPVVGIVLLLILTVLEVIAIVQVMMGRAKEPWLVRSLKFLGK